jgi:hypothetical protein
MRGIGQPRLLLQKAKMLYDAIAASEGFYSTPVDPGAANLVMTSDEQHACQCFYMSCWLCSMQLCDPT